MKSPADKKIKLTQPEKSWVLYDVANSAFILIIVTTIMPIFFKDIASKGIADAISTANWGFANAFASLVLAIMAPLIGTIADYQGAKKRFFIFFLLMGVTFTLFLTTVNQGRWLFCLIIFVFARIGYAGANLFYDAFLVDVTENKRMDWISSCGYAWGYIGGAIPFIIVIGLVIYGMSIGTSGEISVFSAKTAFVIVAVWWTIFSVPMLKNVHQVHYIPKTPNPL
jgi:UMF1 family MFS transporter